MKRYSPVTYKILQDYKRRARQIEAVHRQKKLELRPSTDQLIRAAMNRRRKAVLNSL